MARQHPLGRLIPVLLLAGWLVVYAVTARLSDDGLHAYAARAILHGQRLYTDFEYHQAPLLPYLLAAWFRLVGVGMSQAKLFSAGVAALTLWAMATLARRAAGESCSAHWLLWAAALSPSLVLHLQYVQSQGLACLLACGALLLLERAAPPGDGALPAGSSLPAQRPDGSPVTLPREPPPVDRGGAGAGGPAVNPLLAADGSPLPAGPRDREAGGWAFAGAIGLAALAAAARISFVVLLPALLWRQPGRRVVGGVVLWALVLGSCLAPHLLAGHLADMLYLPFGAVGNLVTQRYVALYSQPGGLLAAVTGRLGSWPNQLIYYAPIWILVLLGAVRGGRSPVAVRLLAVALLLTLAHGVLPRRVNHSYLVVAMPFWVAWAAARLAGRPLPRPVLVAVLLALGGVVATSRGVGRVDLSGGRTVLAELTAIGHEIDRRLPSDEPLLTFCVEAAVAADRTVPDGFAAGYFAYFPNMTDAEAARTKMVNPAGLAALLARREPALLLLHESAFQPLETPAVPWPDAHRFWRLVGQGYAPVAAWDAAGEKRERLTLYERR